MTKEPLEGVEFKIVYADGSYVDAAGGTLSSTGLYWTDKAGKISISGISGTIVATETKSIPGYTIDENTRTQTVVINPNDTQTLHFYNDPVGGVEIIKVNEDNHSERIPNTTFEIRKVDDALVDTVTTDKNGRVFVPLKDGSYYAKEVTSNKSFRLDDTPHYFEIKDGKHVTLQVTNKKLSGIVIHKIDSATGEGIYGVKFVLYDANKKPIGEYTSDDEGYIYIDEIPGGLSGRFYLRELEAAPGYTLDKQYKTVYVSPGKTVEIEWENTAVTGQIQIYKYAAEYNEVTGTAAGTPLKGAVYEIVNARSGKVLDYITTDARGVAASKPLPLTRYQIREVTAPAYLMEYSCLKTIANKHKTSIRKIIRQYKDGKTWSVPYETKAGTKRVRPVKIADCKRGEASDIIYQRKKFSWKTTIRQRLNARVCELCGCKEAELYEVHVIRNLNELGNSDWETVMKKKWRKTLVVCSKCHERIHRH